MWLLEKFNNFKDKNFCIWKNQFYTYNWLLTELDIMQDFVDQKLKDNLTIGIVSDYTLKSILLFLICTKNKKIIVPISSLNEQEIKKRVEIVGIETLLTFDANENVILTQTNVKPSHTLIKELINNHQAGLVLFSSGSTGTPKAIVHNLDNLMEIYKDKNPSNLKILIFLMFDHIGGLNTLFSSLSTGMTIVIPESRNPEHIAALIEKHKINILPTSPTFLNLLLISESYKKYKLSSLRIITYGTEPMPENLLIKLKNIFPTAKFLQTFGTSETGISKTFSKSSESLYMKIEDPHMQWKVIDGELWLKGETTMVGYLNYDNPFKENDWYPTGDLVEVTEDGYIKIIGRKNEIINVGGQKVLPLEVENVILELDEVQDVIINGESNLIMGQIVVAQVIVNKEENKEEIIKKIKLHCKNKLDRYKIPSKIIIVNNLNYGERFKKNRRIGYKKEDTNNGNI